MQAKIKEAAAYLRSVLKDKPKIALITATGLEKVTASIEERTRISYLTMNQEMKFDPGSSESIERLSCCML